MVMACLNGAVADSGFAQLVRHGACHQPPHDISIDNPPHPSRGFVQRSQSTQQDGVVDRCRKGQEMAVPDMIEQRPQVREVRRFTTNWNSSSSKGIDG